MAKTGSWYLGIAEQSIDERPPEQKHFDISAKVGLALRVDVRADCLVSEDIRNQEKRGAQRHIVRMIDK